MRNLLDEFLEDENEEVVETKPVKEMPKKVEPKKIVEESDTVSGDEIIKIIKEAVREEMKKTAIQVDKKAVESINQIVDEHVTDLSDRIIKDVKKGLNLTRHIIEIPNKPEIVTEHPLHKCFDDVMCMLMAGFNVYLYGEAGTGKTQIAEDIANAMNLEMYNLTSGDMVGVYGYTDLQGKFHETPFTKAFTNGGILYISEFDSIDPTIALTLNTAIANGITTINDKTVRKHKDFYCVCDGNTKGSGGNFAYSGRMQLDASTINRFLYQEVDYDRNIELYLANKNEDLVTFIDSVRKECQRNDIQCLVTYRTIQAITALETKLGVEKALKVSLLKGISEDELNSLKKHLPLTHNRYATILKEMEL